VPPKITLNGSTTVRLQPEDVYRDPGASAVDSFDGDVQLVVNDVTTKESALEMVVVRAPLLCF
jgi:hypothetical protein